MRSSGIGGQAVIEGVMMKNKSVYAVAVRKPNQEIVVDKKEVKSLNEKYPIFKWPIIRGVVSFIDSLVIGMKTLTYSASFLEEEEGKEEPSKLEKKFQNIFQEKAEAVIMTATIIASIMLAIAIFILLPFGISRLLEKQITSNTLLTIIEGILRMAIFIIYVIAISKMKDIQRLFMYHGAEHKTINCVENGLDLTVENVRTQSRKHRRCGTSFMFLVMIVSIIFFVFIRVDNPWLRIIYRLFLIPIIAGVSYEFIRFAGKSDNVIAVVLSKPGLWLQNLTTREPDDSIIEVAIASVESVFDWKEFQRENRNRRIARMAQRKTERKETEKWEEEINLSFEERETTEEIESSPKSKVISLEEASKRKQKNLKKNIEKKQEPSEKYNASRKPEDIEEDDDEILAALDRLLEPKDDPEE